MKREEIIEKVRKSINRRKLGADVYPHNKLNNMIIAEVDGDWRHDHLAVERLFDRNGCHLMYKEIYDQDCEDFYSGKHYYIIDNYEG